MRWSSCRLCFLRKYSLTRVIDGKSSGVWQGSWVRCSLEMMGARNVTLSEFDKAESIQALFSLKAQAHLTQYLHAARHAGLYR